MLRNAQCILLMLNACLMLAQRSLYIAHAHACCLMMLMYDAARCSLNTHCMLLNACCVLLNAHRISLMPMYII